MTVAERLIPPGTMLPAFKEAQQRAKAIRRALGTLSDTLARLEEAASEAWNAEDWKTLGYGSWTAYCQAEFGAHRIRLTVDERRSIVERLHGDAMSTRGIGALLGVGRMTVQRDLEAGDGKQAGPVKGADGKTYKRRSKPEPEPPISDEEISKLEAEIRRKVAEAGPIDNYRPPGRYVTVTVLTDNEEAYEKALEGTRAYVCQACCGSARYLIRDMRICSRHIARALDEIGSGDV